MPIHLPAPGRRSGHRFEAFRAPAAHVERLIHPGLNSAADLIRRNIQYAQSYPTPLSELRGTARRQLLRDAFRYTSAYRDTSPIDPTAQPIVMAGHQPTLFHPGVWFKNFALDHLSRDCAAIAINLVVDSDVAGASGIRVPHVDEVNGKLGLTSVAYDRRSGGVPYEQALIEDRDLFDGFDQNVVQAVAGVIENPAINRLWPHAREAIHRCGYAGCALAQARHRLESELGLQTVEIPQSVVCRGEAFAAFAMQILMDLPRFHDCYNRSAEEYRLAHGIRSSAHPVPNLGRQDDWYEAPFWVYGNQSPKRRAVWVRRSSSEAVMEISDRDTRHRKLDVSNPNTAAESFAAIASPEMKIRSRALVTTMYARLVLSDLFLHGIGGGKYDQLGDLISRAFWGIQPPEFMVISATVLLPGHERTSVIETDEAIHRVARTQRDSGFQPEKFADSVSIPAELVAAKRALLKAIPPRGQRRNWHSEVTRLNEQMSKYFDEFRNRLQTQRETLVEQRREAAIWHSRELSFALYPLDYLTDAYQRMLS